MRTPTITGAVKAFSCIVAIVAASAHGATPATRGVDDSRIAVTNVAGQVDVTMAGRPVTVRENATVLLPARIVTGSDGTLGMTQAGTKINVAHDTDVEIPAEAVDGNLVARLVQHRGNVFYDVAPRDMGKLRVETPLLVAVIKGTQFNVAVQGDSTTITLFEGRLELRTPDGSDVVDLNAGEIAIRSLIDDTIRIVGMDDERVAAPPAPVARSANAADARTAPGDQPATTVAVVNGAATTVGVATPVAQDVAQKPVATLTEFRDVELSTHAAVTAADAVAVKTDLSVVANLGLGAANVDNVAAGAGVDLAAGSIDAGIGVGADLDLGNVVAADSGVSVDLDSGLDLDVALDLGEDLDLGDTLDLGLETENETPAGTGSQTTPPAPVVPGLGGLLRRP